LVTLLTALRRAVQRFGPYLVVEVLLPAERSSRCFFCSTGAGGCAMGGPPAATLAPYAMHAMASRRQRYLTA
jgi:hypothetical protein